MIERLEGGVLPSEDEWRGHVELLCRKTTPASKEEVKQALLSAVEKRIPKEKFGVFIGGGVDGILLAFLLKKYTADFVCCSVGIKGSHDIEGAKSAAEKLKLDLKYKEYTAEEIELIFKKTAKLFDMPDVITVGIGSVFVAAKELADVKIFFSGLGSEEIFAGYQRHEKADDVNEECWRGLKLMWQRDLVRDFTIGKKLGFQLRLPFLDDELIKKAMGIPSEMKINQEHKKVILREIAEELGLPKEIAWRQKKAAQYGSGFDRVMEKLAKRNKLSKSDFVKSL